MSRLVEISDVFKEVAKRKDEHVAKKINVAKEYEILGVQRVKEEIKVL